MLPLNREERGPCKGAENAGNGHERPVPGESTRYGQLRDDHHFRGTYSHREGLSVKAGEKLVDFGTLYIVDASNELGQVEIVAQKPLVKADIDKIEYNVQDDPDAQSNSVLEMLRKVPLVTVDGEDNIQVNGSSSFKVYVNGKPNNMMSNNPTEVLKVCLQTVSSILK